MRHFYIDWEAQQAICPQGQTSVKWKPDQDNTGQPIVQIVFPTSGCQACPVLKDCTRSRYGRHISVRSREQYQALQQRRQEQVTDTFKTRYGKRAGIEGTFTQGNRIAGLRQARYIGLAKTRLQHIFTATAINLVRYDAWLREVPFAKTRISRFKALQPQAA